MSKKNSLLEKLQSKLPFGKKKAEPEAETHTEITDSSGSVLSITSSRRRS